MMSAAELIVSIDAACPTHLGVSVDVDEEKVFLRIPTEHAIEADVAARRIVCAPWSLELEIVDGQGR